MTDEKHDELDNALDAALAKYSAVEPRLGLEDRVLANLRAEPAQIPGLASWRWTVMAALAAIVVVAIAIAWKSGRPSPPVVAHRAPITVQAPKKGAQNGSTSGDAGRPQTRAVRRTVTPRSQPKAVVASNPKLDQFPSPQPLSEQEKILANYVTRYPQHAALIAQARTEALRKDRIDEMRDAAAGTEQDSQR